MAEKKKGLIKFIASNAAIISVLITLITAIITANYQFAENRRKSSDENFRDIVKTLSSEKKGERLAAASNMGIFIKEGSRWPFIIIKSGGEYFNDAVDILINRVSVELDYNVLNAIKGSLQKVKKKKHEKYGKEEVINKLLEINRNMFTQDYAIDKWKEDSRKEYFQKEKEYHDNLKAKRDKAILDNIKEEMKGKQKIYFDREMEYKELSMHKQVSADFISLFLEGPRLEKLRFFQNSMNSALLIGLDLREATLEKSAFSLSTIQETKFDDSTIIDTVFTGSDLTKSSFKVSMITASLFDQAILKNVNFSDSEFKDVFFVGSDLTGADFKGVKDLKPVYFYAAKNIDKAKFDNQEFFEKSKDIERDDFIKYVYYESKLSKESKRDLVKSLYKISDKKEKNEIIESLYKLLGRQEREELIKIFDMLFGDQKITDNYIKIHNSITTK